MMLHLNQHLTIIELFVFNPQLMARWTYSLHYVFKNNSPQLLDLLQFL